MSWIALSHKFWKVINDNKWQTPKTLKKKFQSWEFDFFEWGLRGQSMFKLNEFVSLQRFQWELYDGWLAL
jgi:hypothetical protein